MVVGDIPDYAGVDDLRIIMNVSNIDGVNGILGYCGPTKVRPGSLLPYQAEGVIDSADGSNPFMLAILIHEMMHGLGFGTLWEYLALVRNLNLPTVKYVGAAALAQYNSVFQVSFASVPLENTGGAGTAGSHWRESVFANELMTGFLNQNTPTNPFSVISVGALEDLGYTVNYTAAQPYTPSAPAVASLLSMSSDNNSGNNNNYLPIVLADVHSYKGPIG